MRFPRPADQRSIWLCLYAMLALSALRLPQDSARADEPESELSRNLANAKFDHYAVAPGYSEGPTWLRGELYFCSGALLRVDKQQVVHPFLDIRPAGTVARADGHLLICDNQNKAAARFIAGWQSGRRRRAVRNPAAAQPERPDHRRAGKCLLDRSRGFDSRQADR